MMEDQNKSKLESKWSRGKGLVINITKVSAVTIQEKSTAVITKVTSNTYDYNILLCCIGYNK